MKRDELIYTRFGRVVHNFWLNLRAGAYTVDDFGNSVPVANPMVRLYINQEH